MQSVPLRGAYVTAQNPGLIGIGFRRQPGLQHSLKAMNAAMKDLGPFCH